MDESTDGVYQGLDDFDADGGGGGDGVLHYASTGGLSSTLVGGSPTPDVYRSTALSGRHASSRSAAAEQLAEVEKIPFQPSWLYERPALWDDFLPPQTAEPSVSRYSISDVIDFCFAGGFTRTR